MSFVGHKRRHSEIEEPIPNTSQYARAAGLRPYSGGGSSSAAAAARDPAIAYSVPVAASSFASSSGGTHAFDRSSPGRAQPPEISVGLPGRYSTRRAAAFVSQVEDETGLHTVVHNDDWKGVSNYSGEQRSAEEDAKAEEQWQAVMTTGIGGLSISGAVPYVDPGPVVARMDIDAVRDRIRTDDADFDRDKVERDKSIRAGLAAVNKLYQKYNGDVPLDGLFQTQTTPDSKEAMNTDADDVYPFQESVDNLRTYHYQQERDNRAKTFVRIDDSIEDDMEQTRFDRLAPVRAMFKCAQEIQAAAGITFEPMQRDFFREFVIACGPSIYGATRWADVQLDFMREFGLSRHSANALALTPRRFGKTWIVTIFVLAFLLTVPGKKIVIISQNKRTSVLLLKLIKSFMNYRSEWSDRIALDSLDHIAVLPKGVGAGMSQAQKKNHPLVSTVWALPSTSDGMSVPSSSSLCVHRIQNGRGACVKDKDKVGNRKWST